MKVQLLLPEATVPTRGSAGAAGLDLYAAEHFVLYPYSRELIRTGVAVQTAADEVGLIWPRSGLAVKYGVDTLAGVVDNDYRSGIGVALINHGGRPVTIEVGDRIAQLIIQKCSFDEPEVVDELDKTVRGVKGFGSTGK
mgnify:CR=1 FL=1